MPVDYTIKRYSLIVSKIQEGKYPSLSQLLQLLRNNDVKVSERTLQRDIEHLRVHYSLELEYSIEHKGYYLKDASHVLAQVFLRLLNFIQPGNIVLDALRDGGKLQHVHLGNEIEMAGIHQIKDILTAIHQKRVIQFQHRNYHTEEVKFVSLEPLLIKEYHERWYVYGFAKEVKAYRTYGIDRISELSVERTTFVADRGHDASARFNEQIGVTMAEGGIETVIIHFSPLQARYVQSLPWHHSQKVLSEDETGITFQWQLKINYELLLNILQCADQVEVLQPLSLRKEVMDTLESALQKYRKSQL
jgi:predicted DNA-binding transcriptional regulator YafY